MKRLIYIALALLILYEFARVYFLMPMPGSQQADTLPIAWFLHEWRWVIRGILAVGIAVGFGPAWKGRKTPLIIAVILACCAGIAFNGPMTAAFMFRPVKNLKMLAASQNKVEEDVQILGVVIGDEARAYPVYMLGYHHRVMDTVGGEPIFVTYCTVCHTGRVFSPVVDGDTLAFHLVGMDHFNAMFEDTRTGSWWRQATGEAVTGQMKGKKLPEIPSTQMALSQWLRMYPKSKIMQGDPKRESEYKRLRGYENGRGGKLTGRDTGSWKPKSWVLGIQGVTGAKVYDWNLLRRKGWIADTFEGKTILLMKTADTAGYSAWYIPVGMEDFVQVEVGESGIGTPGFSVNHLGEFTVLHELESGSDKIHIERGSFHLKPAPVFQEFWHSWNQFHPGSKRYTSQ